MLNPILVPTNPAPIAVVPGLLFDFLVKLPLIASDALIAYFIHKIVLKYFGATTGPSIGAGHSGSL